MSIFPKFLIFSLLLLAHKVDSSHKITLKSPTVQSSQILGDGIPNRKLTQCHSSCLTCFSSQENNCLSCEVNKILQNGQCVLGLNNKILQAGQASTQIDLSPKEGEDDSLDSIISAHVIINVIGWGFLIDIAIFSLKVLRHRDRYLLLHAISFILNDLSTIIIGIVILSKYSDNINNPSSMEDIFKAHVALAIISIILTFIQHVIGVVIAKSLESPKGGVYVYKIRKFHKVKKKKTSNFYQHLNI